MEKRLGTFGGLTVYTVGVISIYESMNAWKEVQPHKERVSCMWRRTVVGEWQHIRAGKETSVVDREEMESSVLKVKEGDFRNGYSLVRKHGSEVRTRLRNQTLWVKSLLYF